jgi:hypothetical protein
MDMAPDNLKMLTGARHEDVGLHGVGKSWAERAGGVGSAMLGKRVD